MSIDCHYCDAKWTRRGFELDEKHVIPSFRAELEDGPHFADFRLGWNESGIFVSLRTTGKDQSPWCRESRVEDSDGSFDLARHTKYAVGASGDSVLPSLRITSARSGPPDG